RYEDNRPPEFGGPNVKYHPEDRWLSLDVVNSAASPREEEITARRDAVDKKLAEAEAKVRAEARAADKARAEARAGERLRRRRQKKIRAVREQNAGVQKALEEAAREAEKDDELQPVADGARATAGKEMKEAGKALDKAADPKANSTRREGAFHAAE